LNVLNTIAKHNAENMLDLTEKVLNVSRDNHWEIKAQSMEFAITILKQFSGNAHLLQ
jgi:hypothetical protein